MLKGDRKLENFCGMGEKKRNGEERRIMAKEGLVFYCQQGRSFMLLRINACWQTFNVSLFSGLPFC